MTDQAIDATEIIDDLAGQVGTAAKEKAVLVAQIRKLVKERDEAYRELRESKGGADDDA